MKHHIEDTGFVKNIIADLRGGIPDRCSFCNCAPVPPDNIHPEEGGDWACGSCLEQWHMEELENYRRLYFELLYAVARKHPNEDRHHTALRYIQEAESSSDTATAQSEAGKNSPEPLL